MTPEAIWAARRRLEQASELDDEGESPGAHERMHAAPAVARRSRATVAKV